MLNVFMLTVTFIVVMLNGSVLSVTMLLELDLPTPVSCPPSLEWCLSTAWCTLGAKARGKALVSGAQVPFKGRRAGYRCWQV
jgi:hypothetical protein